jgi:hypothetical protein
MPRASRTVVLRLRDGHPAPLGLAAEQAGQEVLDVDVHLLDALVGDDLEGRKRLVHHLDFDQAFLELPFPQELAEPFAPFRDVRVGERRHQQLDQSLLDAGARAVADVSGLLLADHLDGDLRQVADDRLDVAAYVADLGELGRLDLQEWRVREPREPPRDLGLPHSCGPDHQDVLGKDLARHLRIELLAPPAVAQGDRHRALGAALPDDVLVELRSDLPRRARAGRSGGRRLLRRDGLARHQEDHVTAPPA